VEEDWLAWCEALEASGQLLDPDEEEPGEDAAPWDADLDDEVAGAIAAWDRVETYAAARKHAAAAEFIRRRPRPDSPLEGSAQTPESWDESISAEVAGVLAESRYAADAMLDLARDLARQQVGLHDTRVDFCLGHIAVHPVVRQRVDLVDARAEVLECGEQELGVGAC